MVDADGEYDIPLRDQRYFGAGIRRQGIAFVKASSEEVATQPTKPALNSAQRYFAVVFPNGVPGAEESQEADQSNPNEFCETCQVMIGKHETMAQHRSSLSHQVRRPHSNPPSNIDRSRMGLSVLQKHGWDPDAGTGLGAEKEGIVHPLKPKGNQNRSGIGAVPAPAGKVEKPVKLHAGQVRALDRLQKKRAERLRKDFYGDGKEEKYLTRSTPASDNEAVTAAKRNVTHGRWV